MKMHPLNKEFTWQNAPGPLNYVSPEQARDYNEKGGFVLADAFSAAEIAELLAELDPLEAQRNADLQGIDPNQPTIARPDEIVFSAHAVLVSEQARRFARHPTMQKLVRDLIGPDVRLYWDQLVYKRPGTQDDFPWHQDNGYNYVQPQQYLTCWIALTDATIENGCPWIAPGMHVNGTLAHEWTSIGFQCLADSPKDAQALEVKAGSVAVFSSLTPHRTGPNLTQGTRKTYILQYAPEGAHIHPRDAAPHLANDPQRQFVVT
jgi:ectoine hydroxylase-related dioxygenase (phytanoyl-CoA dioxygenase family)